MKTLLSLFDYSGTWSGPFWDSGKWDVVQVDLKHGDDILGITTAEQCLDTWGDVDGILAAVPCTDFGVCGSQYWPAKDASGQTAKSLELLRATFRIVDLYRPTDPDYFAEGGTFFWAVENPVGRLPSLVNVWPTVDLDENGGWTDKPFRPWYFNPHEFAGHLAPDAATLAALDAIRKKNGEGVTAAEADFVLRSNAYTKKTGIWGDFRRPELAPIAPVRCCAQGSPIQRLGGKSEKTKTIRSNTPEGFAKAFFAANGGN